MYVGIWLDGNLSNVMLEHVNWIMSTGIIAHATGGKIYAKYPKLKQQVEDSVKEDIIKLEKVNAPTREIADHVSKSSGQMFTTTDIRNRINKYNSEIHGDENDIDDFLMTLSKMVAMRTRELVQTHRQLKALSEARPNLFFTDTNTSCISQHMLVL